MAKQAFEPTGLVPRSIVRTFDRFRQQLLPETKAAAVQEFRVSRYQVLTSLKCLASLLVVPFLVNQLAKAALLTPAIEYIWNTQQKEIFLNSYQEDKALHEVENFSERVYFESLLKEQPSQCIPKQGPCQVVAADPGLVGHPLDERGWPTNPQLALSGGPQLALSGGPQLALSKGPQLALRAPPQALPQLALRASPPPFNREEGLQTGLQQKTIELATLYNKESMLAIVNLLGDVITVVTLLALFVGMRPQIIILRSFLTESLYSLSDTTKSFLLILVTDLLVGFHSPRGWEIGIELLLRHLGLPEDQDLIFVFVAAFPVFLDTIFKYWIFRYLNKISPSTVATYHNMIE